MFSYKVLLVTFLATQCSLSLAKISPDYFKPCVGLKSDCLKKNVQDTIPHFVKGIPSLGVNSTDPLYYGNIKVDLPGGLKVEFTAGVMKGLRNCIVNDVKFQNNEGDIEVTCNLSIKGKYKAQGQILIVSINGDGDAKLKITGMVLKAKLKFGDSIRDGVNYYELKDYKVTYSIKDKVHFALTNLFKGNPELSETIQTFLNENWQVVVEEFGKPVIDPVIDTTMKNVQITFNRIPKDEIVVY